MCMYVFIDIYPHTYIETEVAEVYQVTENFFS